MADYKAFLIKLQQNLNILWERESKYGGNAQLELLNQIEDHQKALALTEEAIGGDISETEWREQLRPLLVAIDSRSGEVASSVTIGDIEGGIHDSTIAGGDVVGRDKVGADKIGRDKFIIERLIINYPPPLRTVTKVETPATTEPIPDNPYRGLFAFRPEHAHLFFGRETFTEKLIQATESRNLVAVMGASGTGKSSVVFAGLVPALLNWSDDKWLFTTFRPGDDPFLGLANALIPLLDPELSKTRQTSEARDLATRLRESRSPLSDYLDTIHYRYPDSHLLLIADQFEELYTLCRDTDLRQRFLDVLLTMAGAIQKRSPCLVLTLRADFLGQASLYRPFADELQGRTELLGPMTRPEMTEAIEKPAEIQGVHFEAKLVDRILDDVGEKEGSLPLLEFALTELWQHQHRRILTHVAYNEIGEIKGALSRYADTAYQRLTPAEQEQARRVFVQLVNPGTGTEDTRRLARRIELETHWSLVARLANERLVVTNRAEDAQETVEVVHEALIQHWGQLREWMEKDRDFRTWQERLRFAMDEWLDTQDEDALLRGAPLAEAEGWLAKREADLSPAEQDFIYASLAQRHKQEQQRKLLFWSAIAVAVVMTILAIFSIFQYREANTQRTAAQAAEAEAVLERDRAATAEFDAIEQKAIAEAASTTVAQQLAVAEAELSFSRSNTTEERLVLLARLIELGRGDMVGKLLSRLPTRAEQSAVFNVEDERLVEVIREIYVSLADVNRTGYADPLLQAMVQGLARLPAPFAEADTLQSEIEQWLQARQHAREEGRYQVALDEYDQLMALNEHNPSVLYERARVLAGLGMYKKALIDLDRMVELANHNPSFCHQRADDSSYRAADLLG